MSMDPRLSIEVMTDPSSHPEQTLRMISIASSGDNPEDRFSFDTAQLKSIF